MWLIWVREEPLLTTAAVTLVCLAAIGDGPGGDFSSARNLVVFRAHSSVSSMDFVDAEGADILDTLSIAVDELLSRSAQPSGRSPCYPPRGSKH